jgi:hypothetical protein
MKTHPNSTLIIALAMLFLTSAFALAKDEPIGLESCPVQVQAVIRQYAAKATLEEIGFDKKLKPGGSPVYEAKFTAKDGQRFELHISSTGQVLEIEKKKPKF